MAGTRDAPAGGSGSKRSVTPPRTRSTTGAASSGQHSGRGTQPPDRASVGSELPQGQPHPSASGSAKGNQTDPAYNPLGSPPSQPKSPDGSVHAARIAELEKQLQDKAKAEAKLRKDLESIRTDKAWQTYDQQGHEDLQKAFESLEKQQQQSQDTAQQLASANEGLKEQLRAAHERSKAAQQAKEAAEKTASDNNATLAELDKLRDELARVRKDAAASAAPAAASALPLPSPPPTATHPPLPNLTQPLPQAYQEVLRHFASPPTQDQKPTPIVIPLPRVPPALPGYPSGPEAYDKTALRKHEEQVELVLRSSGFMPWLQVALTSDVVARAATEQSALNATLAHDMLSLGPDTRHCQADNSPTNPATPRQHPTPDNPTVSCSVPLKQGVPTCQVVNPTPDNGPTLTRQPDRNPTGTRPH